MTFGQIFGTRRRNQFERISRDDRFIVCVYKLDDFHDVKRLKYFEEIQWKFVIS